MADLTAFEFDPEDLTLNEAEEIEDLLGVGIDKAMSGDKPKVRALKAVAWVLLRRTQPDITLDEVGEMKLSAITAGDNTGE